MNVYLHDIICFCTLQMKLRNPNKNTVTKERFLAYNRQQVYMISVIETEARKKDTGSHNGDYIRQSEN